MEKPVPGNGPGAAGTRGEVPVTQVMKRRSWLWVPLLLAACAGGQRGGAGAPARPDLLDPGLYVSPEGEPLAFFVRDGDYRNYFVRRGPAAAHVLTRSGERPRVIAAFPAGNEGIGLWFESVPGGAELWSGARDAAEDLSAAGDFVALQVPARREVPALHGVRGSLQSGATHLRSELVLLANVRTLRDYGYGECLEDAARFAELRSETIELLPERDAVRVRRELIGGGRSLELVLSGRHGTRVSLAQRGSTAREGCALASGAAQVAIDISAESGIELELVVLTDDEPLTPLELPALFRGDVPESPERSALAFLSYEEKLLAGSWRFLTYFGRDTLLSAWLLLPALSSRAVEAGLGAVLERVQLAEAVPAPWGGSIEVGDVAHEEEIGDYAAWKNQGGEPPSDPRKARYDYEMIDDDFLLAPLLLALDDALAASGSSPAAPESKGRALTPELREFLSRRRSDGRSYERALLANLELVLRRACPYADDPAPPEDKRHALVALHPKQSVGQWRDSDSGLAFGRYPFDVNVALVPGSLAAAEAIYTRLDRPALAAEARRMASVWQGVEALFRISREAGQARANVRSYAAAVGIADRSSELEPDAAGNIIDYGIALDASGAPIPVMHSDHGFVLAFTRPSEAYLTDVAKLLTRTFPAGLASPVGVMIANPGLAPADYRVTDPKSFDDVADDVSVPLRSLFTAAHYHGTVVWSWQQALLAAGLRRQLERADLGDATRALLVRAECALWREIDLTRSAGRRELWSWAPDGSGVPALRPFGEGGSDADESNAIQLWSTVYLAVRGPTPAQNPECGAAGVTP
jgi:hypothetical protein